MGFKSRRAKRADDEKTASTAKDAPGFTHSSGAANLEAVLGDHTLDAEAEARAPQGYRARSVGKLNPKRS